MNNVIYHYCNIDSFKAIIQNKTLWLSSIYNLNDYKEIHWIKDKVAKRIKELTTKHNFTKYELFEQMYLKQHPLVYVASFSQGQDLLSQWRAYANDGKGMAIGFNSKYFDNATNIKISKVLYSEEEQNRQIEEILDSIETLDSSIIKTDFEYFKKVCQATITKINNLAAKSKSELFKEEQEVRVIHNPIITNNREKGCYTFENSISNMKFRTCHDNIIPYFELKFDDRQNKIAPIVEVIKGPKNRAIDKEIRMFMSLNGFHDMQIKKSKASYR
ncbi:hypothetical protein CP960_12630 [Malaciobacter halophilus]|uniref:DUF2971 domain-containing protein n=1 Tax=Malaciobacter halophilus TaxID=197482 RepID=A0A2N1IZX1_9BACT|nr:DUF2971 domain-containing protein [Malaciobacter halophilus]AXH10530.1 DUF2971 domain-containing protein [Malaciobacter halophilus]PKI79849.1 hypothetical protein CP960_12630 [Malaciobacter halophilus]